MAKDTVILRGQVERARGWPGGRLPPLDTRWWRRLQEGSEGAAGTSF